MNQRQDEYLDDEYAVADASSRSRFARFCARLGGALVGTVWVVSMTYLPRIISRARPT